MKKPKTWCDKDLLEDEPFLSAFKARQIAGPPARQCTGRGDDDAKRNEAVEEEIKKNRKLGKVVQAWVDLAFNTPHHYDDKKCLKRVGAGEPGILNLFVQFYWTLSQNQEVATSILQKERRRRGYVSTLDIPQQAGHISTDSKKVKADLGKLKFKKYINAKTQKDALSGCLEQENTRLQGYPPSLDPTSELSETQDLCQIELNSSTLPLPASQNTTCDPQLCLETHLAQKRQRSHSIGAVAKKTPRPKDANFDELLPASNNTINGQSFDQRTESYDRVSSQIKGKSSSILDALGREDFTVPKDVNGELRHISNDAINGQSFDKRTESHNRVISQKKRKSTSLGALEGETHTVVSREVPLGRPKQAVTTSHRETKRRKIVQEDNNDELTKGETTVPEPRGKKRSRTKKKGVFKLESSNISIIQDETYPAMGLSPINEGLFHQPKQDETITVPRRRSASSSEDRQHKRQKVPVDQEGSVIITIQPNSVESRPPKKSEQEGLTVHLAKRKRDRSPKSEVLSSTQACSEVEMIFSFSERSIEIKQLEEVSIPSCTLLPPVQPHDFVGLEDGNGWWTQDLDLTVVSAATQRDQLTDAFPTHKPPLDVMPPIWAQSRQEVCETFDWFRSYQGGVYFAHNIVKGYLLSAFSSKRDRFEHGGRLIISHGGGRAESLHTRKGQTTVQPATDQLAQDKSVRALLDNYRNQRPLVLLIDDKYNLFPYDLGARDMTYVVLGFYTIAHAWAEYQPSSNETGRVVRYKFAFRWCDDQGWPWWLTGKAPDSSDLTSSSTSTTISLEPTPKRTPKKISKNNQGAMLPTTTVTEAPWPEPKSFVCNVCQLVSPQIYTWSWLCLHPNCPGFWKTIMGRVPPDNLEYDSGFLKLMASLPIPPDFGKLKPDPPFDLLKNETVTSYAFTRGFHCNACGRLSCKSKWEKWECLNCGEHLQVFGPVRKAKEFWSNFLPIGYKDHFIRKISNIEQLPIRSFNYENGMGTIQSFILPDGRGKLHHIQSGSPLGRLEADGIFIEYQEQAMDGRLKFRRWPLRSHKCRGALLANYFSQNAGEPYQYVGGAANTVPFENAPHAVVRARELIQNRIQQALEMRVEFNEVLSAAYMERQKMAFHSDNEVGLGPVVAGLSLGSPALMHFRIHAKHDPLRKQKGNLLSFVLRHGDVLVMDGAGVQEYYEHTVVPNNFRIAATARQINSGHT